MSEDDVLFGYRLQLLDHAARTTVSEACRTFGVHRSTYYRWKRLVDRHGLEVLRPRERRRPKMPNQLPAMVEERIVAFAIAHPGLGPRQIASELRRQKWGGIVVSRNGVWRCLRRHGSTLATSVSPSSPATAREPVAEPHIEVSCPGELVGFDCFFVGRLRGTNGAVWQLSAIDCYSSFAWAELVVCQSDKPHAVQTSRLARRVARDLKRAGWRLERVLCDNGNEFRGEPFQEAVVSLGARVSHIRAGRPQTNGNVEALQRLILEECWRPAFARYLYPRYTGLKRELERYLADYNFDRVHHGRLTNGRIPAEIVYGARKMEAR